VICIKFIKETKIKWRKCACRRVRTKAKAKEMNDNDVFGYGAWF